MSDKILQCLYCQKEVDVANIPVGHSRCPHCGKVLPMKRLQELRQPDVAPPPIPGFGNGPDPAAPIQSPSQPQVQPGVDASQPPPGQGVPPRTPPKRKLIKRQVSAKPKNIKCTNCGAPIEIKNEAMAEMVSCSYCGSVLDLNSPDYKVLRKVLLEKRPASPLPLGSRGSLKGIEWEVIGRVRMLEEGIYSWDEFLLFNPQNGYAWLVLEDGHWTYMRKGKNKPAFNPRWCSLGDKFSHYGRNFQVVDKAQAQITYIEGEFTYQAMVGDKVDYLDAVSPPLMLSAEWTEQELEWLSGEYVTPETIAHAFQVKNMPIPVGVARNQPYQRAAWRKQVTIASLIFAGLFLIMLIGPCVTPRKVANFSVSADQYLNKNQPYLSQPINFTKPTVVKLKLEAPLSNSWIFMDINVIDASNQTVVGLGKEMAYYSGSDWSEGSRSASAAFKIDKAGEYRLSFSGDAGSGTSGGPRRETVNVTVYKGAMLYRYFIIMAIICLFFPLVEFIRFSSYQGKRVGDLNDDDD